MMIQKRTAALAVIGVAVVVLIAMLAYRLGLRHAVAKGGVWNQARDPREGCLTISEAARHTGENACVESRVLRVFTSRSGSTFLDFCPDYRNCSFTSVIFASDRSRFGNLGSLQGREVDVLGEITTYNGRAEVVIRDPKQIRLAH